MPTLGLFRPILILVACMQHTVVVQDQSFTGHQRMLDLKARIVREMVEKIERRDRLAGKRCTGDLGVVVDAVRCAAEIQRAMAERNAGVPADTSGVVNSIRHQKCVLLCPKRIPIDVKIMNRSGSCLK